MTTGNPCLHFKLDYRTCIWFITLYMLSRTLLSIQFPQSKQAINLTNLHLTIITIWQLCNYHISNNGTKKHLFCSSDSAEHTICFLYCVMLRDAHTLLNPNHVQSDYLNLHHVAQPWQLRMLTDTMCFSITLSTVRMARIEQTIPQKTSVYF